MGRGEKSRRCVRPGRVLQEFESVRVPEGLGEPERRLAKIACFGRCLTRKCFQSNIPQNS